MRVLVVIVVLADVREDEMFHVVLEADPEDAIVGNLVIKLVRESAAVPYSG